MNALRRIDPSEEFRPWVGATPRLQRKTILTHQTQMLNDSDTDDSDDGSTDWMIKLPDGTEIDVDSNAEDTDSEDATLGVEREETPSQSDDGGEDTIVLDCGAVVGEDGTIGRFPEEDL